MCTVFGAVQLLSGRIPSEGIVEFCDGFFWGRVCADGWDANDAAVVCRELGYTVDGMFILYTNNYSHIIKFLVLNSSMITLYYI